MTRSRFPTDTRLDIRVGPLEHIDVQALVDAATPPWYNQTLCRVNDAVVRLGLMKASSIGTNTTPKTSASPSWRAAS